MFVGLAQDVGRDLAVGTEAGADNEVALERDEGIQQVRANEFVHLRLIPGGSCFERDSG